MIVSQARIVWLDARAQADDSAVGPKAASLIRLSRNGLPVPAGFCLTADAYREHVEANGILPRITAALDALAWAPLEQKRSALREIREAIVRAPIPEGTRETIETHYRELGAKYVAVRSSASAEDLPGRSFAGQYETCLGITDIDGCLLAVRRCWASLWTQRAWAYRQQHGFDHLAVGMAVIVQALVPADASGVLFTADPTTGRFDRIVIEACWGLGEALVSGRVTPDRFLVRKRDLRLLSKTISAKEVESVLGEHGGLQSQSVEPERRSRPALSRPLVIRLARLAKHAEAKLGSPQDIEWAVHGKTVFFLQSRPITTIPGAASWEDRQIWTNANLGEVLPDVMTPMTASFTEATDDAFLRSVLTILGLEKIDKGRIQKLIAGRLYFNASLGLAIVRHLPGGERVNSRPLVGGEQVAAPDGVPLDLSEDLPGLNVSTARMLLRIPWSIRLMIAHRQKKARAAVQEMREIDCRLQDLDFARMPLEALGRWFMTITRAGSVRFDLLYAVLSAAPLAFLYLVCARWLGDADGVLANSLLADAGDMASARAGLDLERLAAGAREVPSVREMLLAEDDWPALREKLQTTEDGRAFLKSWDRFMACHGHHCRGELEFYNPRWSEMPDYILKLVRGYLAQADMRDLLQDHEERTRRREHLRQRCLGVLRNPVKRMIFDRVLRAARGGSVLRENIKNEDIRWMAMLRRMLLAMGDKLTAAGVLTQMDDVFFLQLPELEAMLHGGPGLEVSQLIAGRRAEYAKNKSITPPKVVVGRFDPGKPVPEPQAATVGADVLHGVAASAGVATGKARVILRSDTDERIETGEILVAPFTDPGWTPYFVPAAAIVTDQGGLLSHGSIVAREYAIPAVVNVPDATRIIKTGQTIRVDGNHGAVTILSQG